MADERMDAERPEADENKIYKYKVCKILKATREENLSVLFGAIELNNGTVIFDDWSKTYGAEVFQRIVNLPTFPDDILIIIETGYVDKIYRDIYYRHYASRHFSQPRNCLRLFLFKYNNEDPSIFPHEAEKNLIGICVIQPNGIIGRSYWNPKYFLASGNYVRTASFSAMLSGHKLNISAFPYTMQDREATTCAEVTVLNLTEYYSQSYTEYRAMFPSDIEEVEELHSAERIFPSRGMNYSDVARNLSRIGLSPRLYLRKNPDVTNEAMQRYLYYYIESGIPFGIAVESSERGILHSVTCVGHGAKTEDWPNNSVINYVTNERDEAGKSFVRSCWIANSADAYKTFVIMDDNDVPYQTVQLEAASPVWKFPTMHGPGPVSYAVQQICVPLYKRVFLEVDGAAEVFLTVLTSKLGYQAVLERLNIDGWADVGREASNPLIVRIFLASSRTYFHERLSALEKIDSDSMDERLGAVYMNLFCPRFVWVCELYSADTFREDHPRAIGEIVLDATSRRAGGDNGGLDSVILVHYPRYVTYREPDSKRADLEFNELLLGKWTPFDQFHGNLHDFSD